MGLFSFYRMFLASGWKITCCFGSPETPADSDGNSRWTWRWWWCWGWSWWRTWLIWQISLTIVDEMMMKTTLTCLQDYDEPKNGLCCPEGKGTLRQTVTNLCRGFVKVVSKLCQRCVKDVSKNCPCTQDFSFLWSWVIRIVFALIANV